MWKAPRFYEDPFTSPPPVTPPSAEYKWASRVGRRGRLLRPRITTLRVVLFLLFAATFLLMSRWHSSATPFVGLHESSNATIVSLAAFKPPELKPYRLPDTIDTFQTYKFRDACSISSLDLHAAFSPLCRTRSDMVTAMSSGGRIGRDAPYMPKGCDMRWFTTEEVCEILGRFDRVVLVGDSMLRHVIGSINVFVRKNIGYGAVTDWNFSLQERKECFCNEQFDVKACSVQGIYKTSDVLKHDPESLKCSNNINVIMEEIVRFPIPDDEIRRLRESTGGSSTKRKAFILGHGLWSNLDVQQSLHWVDEVVEAITGTSEAKMNALFITPNAAGRQKPDEWIVTQGNKALVLYEEAMGIEVVKRGLEHLGTWNMSIQANTYDGVHLDMRGNLVKAMMVINWLNLL